MNLLTLIALSIIAELFTVVYNDEIVYFYKISKSKKNDKINLLNQSSKITFVLIMHSVLGLLYILLILIGIFTGEIPAYLLLVLSLTGFILIKKEVIDLGSKPYVYMDAVISIGILIWWASNKM